MKKLKRTLALALTGYMAVSMLATGAFAAEAPAYSDVPANAAYAEAVEYLSAEKIMDGVGGGNNLAVRDMLLSIEWIKENAEVFGGDPDNITIAGQYDYLIGNTWSEMVGRDSIEVIQSNRYDRAKAYMSEEAKTELLEAMRQGRNGQQWRGALEEVKVAFDKVFPGHDLYDLRTLVSYSNGGFTRDGYYNSSMQASAGQFAHSPEHHTYEYLMTMVRPVDPNAANRFPGGVNLANVRVNYYGYLMNVNAGDIDYENRIWTGELPLPEGATLVELVTDAEGNTTQQPITLVSASAAAAANLEEEAAPAEEETAAPKEKVTAPEEEATAPVNEPETPVEAEEPAPEAEPVPEA